MLKKEAEDWDKSLRREETVLITIFHPEVPIPFATASKGAAINRHPTIPQGIAMKDTFTHAIRVAAAIYPALNGGDCSPGGEP